MRHLCVDRHSLLCIAHAMARHAANCDDVNRCNQITRISLVYIPVLNVYALRYVYIRKYSLMRVTWQINIVSLWQKRAAVISASHKQPFKPSKYLENTNQDTRGDIKSMLFAHQSRQPHCRVPS